MAENKQNKKRVLHNLGLGLSPKEIADSLKLSLPATYKAINELKRLGYIEKMGHRTFRITYTGYKSPLCISELEFFPEKKNNWIRLHELSFTITILYKPKNWDNDKNSIFYKNTNVDFGLTKYINQKVENITCQIHRDKVVVMIPPILKKTEVEAEEEALKQLNAVIRKIEHIYRITLRKEDYINISVSKNSYAHIHNELAKVQIDKKEKLKVFHKDGYVRLLIDNSNNIPELELQHPQLAPTDSRGLSKYWQEWFEKPFYPSDFNEYQKRQIFVENALQNLAENMNTHVQVMKDIDTGIKALTEATKGIYIHTPKVLKEEEFSTARQEALKELNKQKENKESKVSISKTTTSVYSPQNLLTNWLNNKELKE